MTPFVLVTHPRSGATVLASDLARNPGIRMFGELFSDDPEERRRAVEAGAPAAGHPPREPRSYVPGENGATFLREVVYSGPDWDAPLASGFKLFYDHARADPGAACAWTYVESRTDVRVLHLTRANLLDCFLSLQIAFRSGEWVRQHPTPRPRDEPLTLEPKACESFFRETTAARTRFRRQFRDHSVFEIGYESDLLAHYPETVLAAVRFLGVPAHPPHRTIQKQSSRPAGEQIANYPALRSHFAGTEFASFFD